MWMVLCVHLLYAASTTSFLETNHKHAGPCLTAPQAYSTWWMEVHGLGQFERKSTGKFYFSDGVFQTLLRLYSGRRVVLCKRPCKQGTGPVLCCERQGRRGGLVALSGRAGRGRQAAQLKNGSRCGSARAAARRQRALENWFRPPNSLVKNPKIPFFSGWGAWAAHASAALAPPSSKTARRRSRHPQGARNFKSPK